MPKRKTTNYLNNKDMLREIHASKMSYCYAVDDRYTGFDIIVDSLDEIDDKIIMEAKEAKANKLSAACYEDSISSWESQDDISSRPKQADCKIDPDSINLEDLVFRVMTYDHIPEAPGRKKNPKTIADKHVRLNFPPFKHYAFVNGELKEVLRSHWENGLENGSFCQTHGSLTPGLARMMIKLVEKYATRGNWRGYSFNDEMQNSALLQLSEVGLKFNEARSLNPFAYYTSTINNSFTRVLNSEKRNHDMRDDLLQEYGYMPSFSRQMDDESEQRRQRESSEDLDAEELKKHGYNLV